MSHIRRCSGQLYLALEVPPNADADQVRKAYHEQALKYHPDKAGDEYRERFQEIQDAEEILLDPNRRRMYDLFGRAGLRTIEGGIGLEYADLLVSNLHRIRWIVLLLAYICVMLLVQAILLIEEVDNDLGWDWGEIFIPIWIADLVIFGMAAGMLYEMLRAPWKIGMYLLMTVTSFSFVAATIMICLALQEDVTWHAAFAPVMVMIIAYSLSELKTCDIRLYREQLRAAGDPDADDVGVMSRQFFAYTVSIVWRVVCLFLFVLFLWLKVTHQTNMDYYYVFLPLFLWMWLPLVWRLFLICCTNRIVKVMCDRAILSFMLVFTYITSFLMLGLLAVKCHQHDVGVPTVSLVYVMIPPMILLVILIMAFCGIALFLPSSMMQLGAADAFSSTVDGAADSTPFMQASHAAATTNQFQYAAQQGARGNLGQAAAAAKDGARMAGGGASYGATEMSAR